MAIESLRNSFNERVCSNRDTAILNGLERLLNGEKTLLDVGCGNGRFTAKISKKFNLDIQGIDIYCPKTTHSPVLVFDGKTIPFADNSFDSVFFIDVLHHTKDIEQILKEAFRVSKKSVIIKDHYCENHFERSILKLFDFIGNLRPEVPIPYNFKSSNEWDQILKDYSVKRIAWRSPVCPGIFTNQVMYKVQLD